MADFRRNYNSPLLNSGIGSALSGRYKKKQLIDSGIAPKFIPLIPENQTQPAYEEILAQPDTGDLNTTPPAPTTTPRQRSDRIGASVPVEAVKEEPLVKDYTNPEFVGAPDPIWDPADAKRAALVMAADEFEKYMNERSGVGSTESRNLYSQLPHAPLKTKEEEELAALKKNALWEQLFSEKGANIKGEVVGQTEKFQNELEADTAKFRNSYNKAVNDIERLNTRYEAMVEATRTGKPVKFNKVTTGKHSAASYEEYDPRDWQEKARDTLSFKGYLGKERYANGKDIIYDKENDKLYRRVENDTRTHEEVAEPIGDSMEQKIGYTIAAALMAFGAGLQKQDTSIGIKMLQEFAKNEVEQQERVLGRSKGLVENKKNVLELARQEFGDNQVARLAAQNLVLRRAEAQIDELMSRKEASPAALAKLELMKSGVVRQQEVHNEQIANFQANRQHQKDQINVAKTANAIASQRVVDERERAIREQQDRTKALQGNTFGVYDGEMVPSRATTTKKDQEEAQKIVAEYTPILQASDTALEKIKDMKAQGGIDVGAKISDLVADKSTAEIGSRLASLGGDLKNSLQKTGAATTDSEIKRYLEPLLRSDWNSLSLGYVINQLETLNQITFERLNSKADTYNYTYVGRPTLGNSVSNVGQNRERELGIE